MDNEMIERCAKVLWDEYQSQPYTRYGISNAVLFGEEWHGKAVPWSYAMSERIIPTLAQEYKDRVKLVIKAMREPTDKMINAATSSTSGSNIPDHDYDEDVKLHWQSMIDSITND